jgi:nitrate reductase NapE component
MTLIEKFPNRSRRITARYRKCAKHDTTEKPKATIDYTVQKTLAKFYDNEFRNFHIKLLFILLGSFSLLLLIVVNAFAFVDWMIS